MRRFFLLAASLLALAAMPAAGSANVVIRVSKERQAMYVYVDGELEHVWPVSTARRGYTTPSGVYHPTSLERFHRSSRYGWTPMPYSIFFHGGYAIHGSYAVDSIGSPVSHGCIRLYPEDAAELFDLVRYYGPGQTKIIVSH